MKIKKTIKGEKITFWVNFIPNTMTAEVKFLMSDDVVIGKISEDFNYIILPEDYLTPYIIDHGSIPVGKLKISKRMRYDVIDYNTNFNN